MTIIDRVELSGTERTSAETAQISPGFNYLPIPLGNCSGVWSESAVANPERVLLYLHVGALQCCKLDSHQRLLERVSETLQASVLMVDYRTLPEYAVSDGIDDGVNAYRLLLAAGYSPEQVVLAVDSADSDLAIMVPMAIQELALVGPASVVTISPLSDETDFAHAPEDHDPLRCALHPSTLVRAA